MTELEELTQRLRKTLLQVKVELVKSGNWTAKDFGWLKVRESVSSLLTDTTPEFQKNSTGNAVLNEIPECGVRE